MQSKSSSQLCCLFVFFFFFFFFLLEAAPLLSSKRPDPDPLPAHYAPYESAHDYEDEYYGDYYNYEEGEEEEGEELLQYLDNDYWEKETAVAERLIGAEEDPL